MGELGQRHGHNTAKVVKGNDDSEENQWRRQRQIIVAGIHLAVVPGAAISSPWDFLLKVLVISFRFPGKGELRAEACSGVYVGGERDIF